MKKVLVIGGGGREHAIVDALSRSPQVGKIYCAPGNAGISAQAECVPLKDTDVEGLKAFALANDIDLAVVGPEVTTSFGRYVNPTTVLCKLWRTSVSSSTVLFQAPLFSVYLHLWIGW